MHKKSAFILLEIVLAITVFAISALAILKLKLLTDSINKRCEKKASSLQIACNLIEQENGALKHKNLNIKVVEVDGVRLVAGCRVK